MNGFFCLEDITKEEKKNSKRVRKTESYIEETWEPVVKRILYYCKIRHININTLAFQAGVTPSTLKSILYGQSKNPGIVTIRRICDGLNISLEEFFHSRLFREW